MNSALPTINPEKEDKLRDAQREADQEVVNDLREKILRLDEKIAELKAENERLEDWLRSEKMTHKIQYFGYGRF